MDYKNKESLDASVKKKNNKCFKNMCSVQTVKKTLPITEWLPRYNLTFLIQDIIAGITVGLTAIPQGIAYAVVAGLSPEYGLYSGLMGGVVYLIFGSCKVVTVGPTAIMSAIVAKYVASYSDDFAVLATFLSGVVILFMGVFRLGFLVEFISSPVITGFITAASLQIASSQLRSLLGLSGVSGHDFAESIDLFITNITTIRLADSLLGISTIVTLLILKNVGERCKQTDSFMKQILWFISLARNAVVVLIGMLIAYVLKVSTDGNEPLKLIGEIGSGLPKFGLPPFSTVVSNETYTFPDMAKALGPEAIVIPFVAILESVAIAKAFADGGLVDATQEMIALGLCNIFGSFIRSMPITGSFTRTALNHASGVQTTTGGIFTGLLILLALTQLTSSFYFIPQASLAGLIITAMLSMMDFSVFVRLWRSKKLELSILIITMAVSLLLGLEYGIVAGVFCDIVLLLYKIARPKILVNTIEINNSQNYLLLNLNNFVAYCAAEHIRRKIIQTASKTTAVIVIDASNLETMDSTVASNLINAVKDLEKNSRKIFLLNFNSGLQKAFVDINSEICDNFTTTDKIEGQLVKCCDNSKLV